MSTHPNTILLLVLTPDNLARKTYRNILEEENIIDPENDLSINNKNYHHKVMEENYDDGFQISANEGDIIVFDFVTCGYGDNISWEKLEEQKKSLENWAIEKCKNHNCNYKVFITANYW